LHGVPVTTKVNVDQAGLLTDNGVVPLKDFHGPGGQPSRRQPEACRRHHRRPHQRAGLLDAHLHRQRAAWPDAQPARSGGDAGRLERWRGAATAGIGAIAHGNDIGGSVRIPAYCNGVVGLRTGFAASSLNPSAPAGRPIGAVLMAVQGRTPARCAMRALALQVMARGDRRDWRWNDVPMQARAGAADQGRDRARGAGRSDASCASRRGAAGGQAPEGGGLCRRRGAAPDMERGVELWHDLRHRRVQRSVAADAENGRSDGIAR
jgi:amidase